jgi:hypothetical protein
VARFALPAGVAIGIGITAGYLLARYAFGLDVSHSRTVATGVVVVCGLAVVLRLEARGRHRRSIAVGALCLAMALLFGLALAVPFLRDFYELARPTGDAVAAWAVGSALGIGGMLGALRLFRA